MKNRISQCLYFVLFLLLVGCGRGGREPYSISVMTYNVHHGEGPDGVVDLGRTAQVIGSLNPDIVAIQEVDRFTNRSMSQDQTAALAAASGIPFHVFGRAIDFDGGQYGVAILSKFPIVLSGNEMLPHAAENEARTALWVVIEVPGLGEVLMVSTHLQPGPDDDRFRQASRIVELFAQEPLTPAGTTFPPYVILAGDLNDVVGSRTMSLLEGHFFDGFAGPETPTFPSASPNRKIDWIMVRDDSSLVPIASQVVDAPDVSDHLAVYSVLQVP